MKKEREIKKINPFNKLRVNPERSRRIRCAVFKSKNETVETIIRAINETEDIKRKTRFAERIIQEMGELLSCEYFDEKRIECKICHHIANLRVKAANLILKVSPSYRKSGKRQKRFTQGNQSFNSHRKARRQTRRQRVKNK